MTEAEKSVECSKFMIISDFFSHITQSVGAYMLINVHMSENLSEFVLYTNSTHPAANQLLDYFFSSIITFQTLIKCSLHLSSYYESYCLTYKCATSKPQVSVIVYFALK